ncbi:MAG: hypothetical protein H6742_21965 [Alphaproteobacteria bacterium]|nr:hypothetical protein [Alphaproteobacteria bacterium]
MSILLLLLACAVDPPPPAPAPPLDPAALAPAVGPVAAADVQARVADAKARLQDSEAGRLLWRAIEAHGGLAAWHGAGTLQFDFDYAPLDQPDRRMFTHNRIDLWSSRALQEELPASLPPEERALLGWDGTEAWIAPGPDAFPSTARFWALTPYYFVGMPFVLADPGVRLERLPDAELGGVEHRVVRARFDDGVGDAPDDYYVLYLHPETGRVGGLRYVVSFPGFFPDGGHSPEKLMVYSDPVAVGPLTLAGRYDTFRWDADAQVPGDQVTAITAGGFVLGEPIPVAEFSRPAGAVVSPLDAGR